MLKSKILIERRWLGLLGHRRHIPTLDWSLQRIANSHNEIINYYTPGRGGIWTEVVYNYWIFSLLLIITPPPLQDRPQQVLRFSCENYIMGTTFVTFSPVELGRFLSNPGHHICRVDHVNLYKYLLVINWNANNQFSSEYSHKDRKYFEKAVSWLVLFQTWLRSVYRSVMSNKVWDCAGSQQFCPSSRYIIRTELRETVQSSDIRLPQWGRPRDTIKWKMKQLISRS